MYRIAANHPHSIISEYLHDILHSTNLFMEPFEKTFRTKNKWESQSIRKKFKKKGVLYRGTAHKVRKTNSTKLVGWWKPHRSARIHAQNEAKSLCRRHPVESEVDDRFHSYSNDESDEFDQGTAFNHYQSVFLCDFIEVPTVKRRNLKKTSKKNSAKHRSTESQGKLEENSFERYWIECQSFNKALIHKSTSHRNSGNQVKVESEKERGDRINIAQIVKAYFRAFDIGSKLPYSLQTLQSMVPFTVTPLRTRGAGLQAFHGTLTENVDSITKRGLMVGGTNGVSISHGAAYGRGVYCSPSLETASWYSNGAIFACAVQKPNRFEDIWVITKSEWIKARYLIEFEEGDLFRYTPRYCNYIKPGCICLFVPSFGRLNAPQKYRNRQRRFWNLRPQ